MYILDGTSLLQCTCMYEDMFKITNVKSYTATVVRPRKFHQSSSLVNPRTQWVGLGYVYACLCVRAITSEIMTSDIDIWHAG